MDLNAEPTVAQQITALIHGADEQTILEAAEAVREALRHRGILTARASEYDAEIDEVKALASKNQARNAEAAEREAARQIVRARSAAVDRTRPYAGEGWEPGRCTTCQAAISDWDANIGGLFAYLVKFTCDGCQARVRAEAEAEARRKAEKKRRLARDQKLQEAWASLPEGLGDPTLASIAPTGRIMNPEAVTIATRIILTPAPNDPPTLLFVGETGAGKTSLVLALGAELIRRGEDLAASAADVERASGVRFYLAANLARARERSKLGGEAPDIDDALEASLLIIDELGGEPERLQDILEEVVITRASSGKDTLITTGLSGVELTQRYTGGFCRKIAKDPRCALVVHCGLGASRKAAS